MLSSDIAGRFFLKIVSPVSPPKRSLRQSPACLYLWSHAEFPNSSLGKASYKLSSLLFTRGRRASSCPSAWCPRTPRGLVSLRDRAVHLRVHLGSREPSQSLLFSDSIPQKSRTVQVSNSVLAPGWFWRLQAYGTCGTNCGSMSKQVGSRYLLVILRFQNCEKLAQGLDLGRCRTKLPSDGCLPDFG